VAFTGSRFLYLPPHHCFSVPVLKPQVQSHSIALRSGGGHNPISLKTALPANRVVQRGSKSKSFDSEPMTLNGEEMSALQNQHVPLALRDCYLR
jgi:hypothetical protein